MTPREDKTGVMDGHERLLWGESGQSSGRQIGDDKPTPDKRLR